MNLYRFNHPVNLNIGEGPLPETISNNWGQRNHNLRFFNNLVNQRSSEVSSNICKNFIRFYKVELVPLLSTAKTYIFTIFNYKSLVVRQRINCERDCIKAWFPKQWIKRRRSKLEFQHKYWNKPSFLQCRL